MSFLSTLPAAPSCPPWAGFAGSPGETKEGSFAWRVQQQADGVAWELSFRDDLRGVPALVQDFVFGPWARVLAHVRLGAAAGSDDGRRYEAALDDLLWSVKPELTLRAPAGFVETVPVLLRTLREGLALVGEPAAAQERFFRGLMKLHAPVLRLRARSRAGGLGEAELDT